MVRLKAAEINANVIVLKAKAIVLEDIGVALLRACLKS